MTNIEFIENAIAENSGRVDGLSFSGVLNLGKAEKLLSEMESNLERLFKLNRAFEDLDELEKRFGVEIVRVAGSYSTEVSIENTMMYFRYNDTYRDFAKSRFNVICSEADNIQKIVDEEWAKLSNSRKACHVSYAMYDFQKQEIEKMKNFIQFLTSEYEED